MREGCNNNAAMPPKRLMMPTVTTSLVTCLKPKQGFHPSSHYTINHRSICTSADKPTRLPPLHQPINCKSQIVVTANQTGPLDAARADIPCRQGIVKRCARPRTVVTLFCAISGHRVVPFEQQCHHATSWRHALLRSRVLTCDPDAAEPRRPAPYAPVPHPAHPRPHVHPRFSFPARLHAPPPCTASPRRPEPVHTLAPPPKRSALAAQPRALGGKAPVTTPRELCPATPSDGGKGRRGW